MQRVATSGSEALSASRDVVTGDLRIAKRCSATSRRHEGTGVRIRVDLALAVVAGQSDCSERILSATRDPRRRTGDLRVAKRCSATSRRNVGIGLRILADLPLAVVARQSRCYDWISALGAMRDVVTADLRVEKRSSA